MPECHSTNSVALARCQEPNPPSEGAIFITNNQYGGRGQRGNTWTSAAGQNLTFSVVLRPAFLALTDQYMLNLFSALAVADFLRATGCNDVHVKWPNDVYLGDKKVCGILTESQIRGDTILYSVIGIGLNINQKEFSISSATSVYLALGRELDLSAAIGDLARFLEARYLRLKAGGAEALKADYEASLYRRGTLHRFRSEQHGEFYGVISGIDSMGRLIVVVSGHEQVFAHKEIVFLNE